MLFYCYSQQTDATIESSLGDADYSYYFVLKAYLPLLEKLGEARIIDALDDSFVSDCKRELGGGREVFLLAFAPPHKIPQDLPCPIIPVFAWEYSSIPNSEVMTDPQDSWCHALEQFGQALTHSSYAKNVVQTDVSNDFPVECVPAPLWESCPDLRDSDPNFSPVKNRSITLRTTVIDSWDFAITPTSIAPLSQIAPSMGGSAPPADACVDVDLDFGVLNPDMWMVGFYDPEGWGTWSKITNPWIMLPSVVSGRVKVVLRANASGNNVGREIGLQIGSKKLSFTPSAEVETFEFDLDLEQPSNFLTFSDLDISAERPMMDPRTLGVGLAGLSITHESGGQSTQGHKLNVVEHNLNLNGVVYTSIFNPRDARKNWEDILTAFCIAFRERDDVTLILKMTYNDMSGYLDDIFGLFCQLHPFKCRIIVVHGYLPDEDYRALVQSTSFIVNASRGEGQCLPLMEYMSHGIPAIAPNNTAMQDYISTENALIVYSSPEPHYWAHDPQQTYTTLWFRPSWESLHQAYLDSYELAQERPGEYLKMSEAARRSQFEFCSIERLLPRLESLLQHAGK